MLSSVLDLGEISVEEIMTHRASVTAINADDDPEDILRFVLLSPHTRTSSCLCWQAGKYYWRAACQGVVTGDRGK